MPIPESLSSNFVTAAEAERETLAAPRDRDVQRGLDLPQVLVQRSA